MSADRATILTALPDGGDAVLIKAIGPCRMGVCPALHTFIQCHKKPDRSHLYFDLSEAESIDSTFAGLLLSLAMRKSDPSLPELFIVSPNERVLASINGMHLTRFFKICDAMPVARPNWNPLKSPTGNEPTLADTVLEAHEKLIEGDSRNQAAFGRVVEGLREERKSRGPSTSA
ncbi:MAG: hypothetical protein KF841_07915 [Phycisphaerae bacterium]|nr:hypothetical protein [Phycisphaerae bacterium]